MCIRDRLQLQRGGHLQRREAEGRVLAPPLRAVLDAVDGHVRLGVAVPGELRVARRRQDGRDARIRAAHVQGRDGQGHHVRGKPGRDVYKRQLWPFLVLIIFSGLLFYSSFSAINLEFAASFMSATRRTLMLFCWVFMAAQIYRQHLPVCLFFGAGNLLFSQFPAMVGYLIEISHPRLDSFGASLVNVAATAFMALILVVGIVVVALRAKGPQGASLRPAEPADAAQRAMDDIARRCALTPREVEIALLIVKGYTLPMIGERDVYKRQSWFWKWRRTAASTRRKPCVVPPTSSTSTWGRS